MSLYSNIKFPCFLIFSHLFGVHSLFGENPVLLENGTEYFRAPEKFQVILETNVRNSCPVVLNITRSLAPNSTDNFWGMATFRPPIFQQSAFYSVVPGSYVEFGVSGDPDLNLLEGASPMQYDKPSVRNTAGTFAFATKPDNSLGLQVVINLRDNPTFDELKMAPFGKVCPAHRSAATLFLRQQALSRPYPSNDGCAMNLIMRGRVAAGCGERYRGWWMTGCKCVRALCMLLPPPLLRALAYVREVVGREEEGRGRESQRQSQRNKDKGRA
jgi:cyclophilin family peptidyl-prolyl cis-trans isomerase